jgi:hypothetical protein
LQKKYEWYIVTHRSEQNRKISWKKEKEKWI